MQRATRTARATETSAVLSQARSTAVTGRARKSRSGKDREDASSASRVFDAFPPELLQHICNVAAGDDPASPRARATLASLRLACRSLCRAASRVAHRHVVVTRADHARHLLDAIFQDTKKARHSIVVDTDATVPRAKSSFYAPDICALTIRETRPASECGFTGVLTQLPAALRRLPNLDTLLWMMPERPSMDILRAIGKHPKLVKFELIDTQPGPPAPLGHFDERVRDKFFPRIGLVDGLTTLVLRLQVTKLVQFGHELHWRTFCTALHDLQTLETLVIEQVGTYPVTLGALVEGANWPDLRRLALRNVWMENTDDTRLCDFIARHPNIEMLDLSHWFGPSSENGEFTAAVAQLSIALDVLNSQKTHALPNLRHFSMDAPNHRAELMQAAIFKGKAMRPLRHLGVVDNALLSKVSDARYKPTAETAHTVDIADGVVSISLALYEPLFVGLGDLIANAFPNMTSLHLMILRGPRGLDDWVCCFSICSESS